MSFFFFFYLSLTIRIFFLWFLSLVSGLVRLISGLRLADVKELLTYRPEIALTYVYLFCGEPPKIFLMIRLQTTVPFPPLPGLDMGVGEDSLLSGQVSASTFTYHPRPSIYLVPYDISSFPSLEISRRMYCTPR